MNNRGRTAEKQVFGSHDHKFLNASYLHSDPHPSMVTRVFQDNEWSLFLITVFKSSKTHDPFLKSEQGTFILKCSLSHHCHINHSQERLKLVDGNGHFDKKAPGPRSPGRRTALGRQEDCTLARQGKRLTCSPCLLIGQHFLRKL